MTYKNSILTNMCLNTKSEIPVTVFDRVLDQYSLIAWLKTNHCLCLVVKIG